MKKFKLTSSANGKVFRSGLCLFTPFEEFVNNSFSIPTLVYYLTVTTLFLFFTAQGLEKRRWN